MVDVGAKAHTHRIAVATGRITMRAETLELVRSGTAKKGDVLGIARIAAIQGAKKTSDLIPLCHPLALTRIAVDFIYEDADQTHTTAIRCNAIVENFGQTGVEMEALIAVQLGLITIYDMCKSADKTMAITDVFLKEKSGGRTAKKTEIQK